MKKIIMSVVSLLLVSLPQTTMARGGYHSAYNPSFMEKYNEPVVFICLGAIVILSIIYVSIKIYLTYSDN